jgi:hypothetical protein
VSGRRARAVGAHEVVAEWIVERGGVVMTEEENFRQQWGAVLSEPELARIDAAFSLDPDLEQDLRAMVAGLSPKRRGAFVRRFSANLLDADSPQSALLLALSDIRLPESRKEGGEMTGLSDTPAERNEP